MTNRPPKPASDTAQPPTSPDDPMPVFVVKAKDNLAPLIVGQYVRALCDQLLFDQAREAIAALSEINDWRERNPDACKWPDHKHVPAGQPGSGSEAITSERKD